jgi:hypothetical protein
MSNIVSTKVVDAAPFSPKNVVVVLPPLDSRTEPTIALARSIALEFKPLGGSVAMIEVNSLSENESVEDDVTVISLLEYESTVLGSMDENMFERIQILLLRCKEVLWITRSDSADGPGHPSNRIISGLLRCLRSEDTSRRLYELHFARQLGKDAESSSSAICRRLWSIWRSAPDTLNEMDTVERDGCFFIPRYMPDNTMNDSLARSNSQSAVAPRLASLIQAHRPLKLTISQPGRLDTLQFDDDETASGPLRNEVVEFEVRACGLNFM